MVSSVHWATTQSQPMLALCPGCWQEEQVFWLQTKPEQKPHVKCLRGRLTACALMKQKPIPLQKAGYFPVHAAASLAHYPQSCTRQTSFQLERLIVLHWVASAVQLVKVRALGGQGSSPALWLHHISQQHSWLSLNSLQVTVLQTGNNDDN